MSCRRSIPRGDFREETNRTSLPKLRKTGSNQFGQVLASQNQWPLYGSRNGHSRIKSPKSNGLRGISKPRNAAEIIHLKRRKYAVDQFTKITAKFNFWREIQILKGCKIKIFETSKILILPPNFFAA